MNFSNAAYELAELRVEQERDFAIITARAALKAQGAAECVSCEKPIGRARRLAMPSALRCVECQEFHEQEKLHR